MGILLKMQHIVHADALSFTPPGKPDIVIYDPPFDLWGHVKPVASKTYLCFTNYQQRPHIEKLFGKVRAEIIWNMKIQRWVSHKLPLIRHETLLVFGEVKNDCYTGDINTSREPQQKGKGSIGRDKNLGDRTYIPHERKQLTSVLDVPRNMKDGGFAKPLDLLRPVLSWLVNSGDFVFDPYSGSGAVGLICKEIGARYLGCEIDKDKAAISNNTLQGHRKPEPDCDLFGLLSG